MTIDCSKYLIALEKSRKTIDFLWNKTEDKKNVAVDFAVCSGIPLIVVFLFLIKFYGNESDLYDSCFSLSRFYKYSKVIDFDGQELDLS